MKENMKHTLNIVFAVLAFVGQTFAVSEPMKVALTFDDGEMTHLTIAAPLLERYGYRGVFNIVTDNVGKGGRMTWDDIRELKRRGHEIASHTLSHPLLPRLLEQGKTNEVVRQIAGSRDALAWELGEAPRYLCLPGNMSSPAVEALIRKERMEPLACGRPNFGLGTDAGTTNGVGAYLDRELAQGADRVALMVHGIVRGGWQPFLSKKLFEGFLREINEREKSGKIHVVSYSEYAFRPETAVFAATCDAADGVASCGKTVSVRISVSDAAGLVSAGRLTATVDDFYTNVTETLEIDLARGNPFEVRLRRKTPGFARVRIARRNGDWCWGVGFEPERLTKGSPSPVDFDAFWAAGKERLEREVPPDVRLEQVAARSTRDFTFYRLSLATFGRRVNGYLSVPKDHSRAPFPAEVNVAAAGFGNWTNDMPGSRDQVSMFFSVYPFEPDWRWRELGLQSKYNELHRQCYGKYLTGYSTSGFGASREEVFYYPVILGVSRAIDWLSTRDYVDARRIRYQGTSQGGGLGLALSALNKHISRAALFVPALTDTMGYLVGRVSGWPKPVEAQKPQFRAMAEMVAPYFDGANFASRITIPIRVGVGFSDTTCPPCAVYAAFNALASKDKRIRHGLGMTHQCRSEIYGEFGVWLKDDEAKRTVGSVLRKIPGDRSSFGPLSPSARPYERQYLWPDGKMPNVQAHQVAAKTAEQKEAGYRADDFRRPYIDWYRPAESNRTDLCVVTVSGGGFEITCDAERLQPAIDRLVAAGITVADVTYRTPRPHGRPIHASALEDLQRAIRIVRNEAQRRGFSPDKIGATGISAGAKAMLVVATGSQTRAYEPVDAIDDVPCNLMFALPQAPAYVLTDGATGPNERGGEGPGVEIVQDFRFDEKTCPMCFFQGGTDVFSPCGSTRLYRRLRQMGLPAELHLFADRWHGFHGDMNRGEDATAWDHWFDRALEFIRQMNYDGRLAEPAPIWTNQERDVCSVRSAPGLEWRMPERLRTKAVQIVLSESLREEDACRDPVADHVGRFLNEKGMSVVMVRRRSSSSWQDVRQTVCQVRNEARKRGLDPERVGVLGARDGGRLALQMSSSSRRSVCEPSDAADACKCNVQWAIAICPDFKRSGGNLFPDFDFDFDTSPALLIDGLDSESSVAYWERLRRMGIQCDLHALVVKGPDFLRMSSPETGGRTWPQRILEFLNHKGYLTDGEEIGK